MKAPKNIREMIAGNKIAVPNYQRAYSWDTPVKNSDRKTQTDVFLLDLDDYNRSNTESPYYFGHFLFEEKNQKFNIIDGQQRLTTIVIFLSALFSKLKTIRELSEAEEICYEDIIKRRNTVHFSTVDYDDQLFIDYVINQTKIDHNGLETESSWRIVRAFDYFKNQLANKSDDYLTKMLSSITNASCTTHLVHDESEAIQMFIFQNNRGKHPSNLEIVKAQFMYYVHLYGKDKTESLIKEIKNRFEKIYKSISSIEYHISEDDVLIYTIRVYFNSLSQSNALDKISRSLAVENPITFIEEFTGLLSSSFEYLSSFFGKDARGSFAAHSLITLGGISVAFPFIIKAYKYNLNPNDKEKLYSSLESLVFRHRLIGTKAVIISRINDIFEKFNKDNSDISLIISRIDWMKTTNDWWWAFWNNDRLKESLQAEVNPSIARYILWKYENHLIGSGKGGSALRFDQLEKPELEHIAPKTEPTSKPHGYDNYDDEFRKQYIDCLGNYLLLTKKHNASIHNDPFSRKHQDYKWLEQQREVQNLVPEPNTGVWNKEIIQKRKSKIVSFIMSNC